MAPIKIKYIVSFSSQDNCHKVANLLEDGSNKRWLSDQQDRSGQVEAIFQLERPCSFAFIDIGVIWCASIEVRVGKSDWPAGQKYTTLVPTQVIMSPMDCRLGRGTNRACMFSKKGRDGQWDRLQIICRQPWRKDVQLGLSFLRIRSSDGGFPTTSPEAERVACLDEKDCKIQSVKDIQQHFFGKDLNSTEKDKDSSLKARLQKLAASAEGGSENAQALPRIAQMVLAANQQSPRLAPPHSKDEHEGRSLYSSSVAQQNAPELEKEIADFLSTLDIRLDDLDSVCVSDLRHKFEKRKWRKLTADEKRVFFTCCQEFIGNLVESNSSSTPHKTSPVSERKGSGSEKGESPFSVKMPGLSKMSPSAKTANKMSLNKDGLHNAVSTSVSVTPQQSFVKDKGTKNSLAHSGISSVNGQSPKTSETPRPLSDLPNGVGKTAKSMSGDSAMKLVGKVSSPTPLRSVGKSNGLSAALAQKAAMMKLNKTTADTLNKSPVSQTSAAIAGSASYSMNGRTPGKSTVHTPAHSKSLPSANGTSQTKQKLCSASHASLKSYSHPENDSFPTTPSRKRSKKPKTPAYVPNSPGAYTSRFDSSLNTSFESPDLSTPSKKQKVGEMKSSSLEISNPHQTVPKAQPDEDEMLQSVVAQAISTVDVWLNSRRGPRGGREVRGKRGGRHRKSTGKQDTPLPLDSDELPDLNFGDAGFPDFTPGTGKRGGRKRGAGQKRGTGSRGRGRQAASTLQPPSSSSYTSPGSSHNLGNSGGFLRPSFSNSDDHFEELTIDDDAVFVECPLCMQMFPSDTVNLHASFCCT